MTTETPPIDLAAAFAAIEAAMQERKRRTDEARPANKTALFDALAAAGITSVEVRFDGCGDSGQIDHIRALSADAEVSLPEQSIELRKLGKNETIEHETTTVADAIESLVYHVLEETHDGWENNDGAWGDFTFDVATRTITLDYNERYIDAVHHDHVF